MTLFKAAPLLQMGFRTIRRPNLEQFSSIRTSEKLKDLVIIILTSKNNQASKQRGDISRNRNEATSAIDAMIPVVNEARLFDGVHSIQGLIETPAIPGKRSFQATNLIKYRN